MFKFFEKIININNKEGDDQKKEDDQRKTLEKRISDLLPSGCRSCFGMKKTTHDQLVQKVKEKMKCISDKITDDQIGRIIKQILEKQAEPKIESLPVKEAMEELLKSSIKAEKPTVEKELTDEQKTIQWQEAGIKNFLFANYISDLDYNYLTLKIKDIREIIDRKNRENNKDYFNDLHELKKAVEEVKTIKRQEEQIRKVFSLDREVSIGAIKLVRERIHEWNEIDKCNHFQNKDQIRKAKDQLIKEEKIIGAFDEIKNCYWWRTKKEAKEII